MKFIYKDNSQPNKPIVFEVEAETITEADKLYQQVTGQNVVKQSHIGCSIIKDKP